jgi:hypothetical protein
MKSYILILMIAVLVFAGCSEEREGLPEGKAEVVSTEILTQDEMEYQKAGNLNVLERRTYSAFFINGTELPEKDYLVETLGFDEKGNKVKQARFLTNGALEIEWNYKYDDKGNLVEMLSKDMYDQILYSRKSKFDKWGNELERTEFDRQMKGEFDVKLFYTLDGYLVEKRTFNEEEKPWGKEEYQYQGNLLVLKKSYDENGKLFSENKYFYDGLDNLLMDITYSPPNFRDTVKYLYDEKSRLIKISTNYKQEFKYSEDDNVTEEWFYNQLGGLQQYITYEYDEKGLLINKIKHDGMQTPVLNIRYEYDYYDDQLAEK